MSKQHLYCFVDESGQDTLGGFFLVVAVLIEQEFYDNSQETLLNLETATKKGKLKWTKTSFAIKQKYLEELCKPQRPNIVIYYSIYHDTKEYTALSALTIAKAILAKNSTDYSATIVIDGLTKKNTEEVRVELKKLRIHYKSIRGLKDGQSAFLRLADCLAGFLRDYTEQQSYAAPIFRKLQKHGILMEV